jgi:hypothetical protein
MAVEKDITGASNDANDAPSLQAARSSGRRRAPSKKLLASQCQELPTKPTKVPSRQKNKPQFQVYEDPFSPPPTQATDTSSQGLYQIGVSSISPQKKRTRASKTKLKTLPEKWESEFNSAPDKTTKFKALLEALRHKDFKNPMKIPERVSKANLSGQKLDPLDPLAL